MLWEARSVQCVKALSHRETEGCPEQGPLLSTHQPTLALQPRQETAVFQLILSIVTMDFLRTGNMTTGEEVGVGGGVGRGGSGGGSSPVNGSLTF